MYLLAISFNKDMECALYNSLQNYIDVVGMFSIRTKVETEILQILKWILLKLSNLIKHIAAMTQHNPFSVYSNNCNELANKYGANVYLCTNRILN